MNEVLYNGIRFSDYGYVFGKDMHATPKRETESVSVAGRNGTVTIDKGRYENVTVEYSIIVQADEHFSCDDKIQAMREAFDIVGFHRLEDTFNADEYYMAALSSKITVKQKADDAAIVTIKMTRYPQRFLIAGENEIELTSGNSVYNPTTKESKPVFCVYGNGTLGVGDDTIVISESPYPYVFIDSDVMECYYDTNNANVYMTGDFPSLKSGETMITWDGFTKVTCIPNWWRM